MLRLVCSFAMLAALATPRPAQAGQCEGITVTVDNDDPGSGYSEVQPENFQEHNVDACADTYRYLSRYVGDESTDGRAIWQPTITIEGSYRVVTGFRASENRTDDADYLLIGDDGSQQARVVDQRGNGCEMVDLGEIWCVPGGSCRLELDGTDDMKSDAADVTTFELVDCEPPEPSPCDPLVDAGFEVCGSGPNTCEGVYNAGEGCIALCASVGMMCVERYGGEPGCLQEDGAIPCDEVNDHASNYCVCQGEPAPETTSSGGDDGSSEAGDPDGSEGASSVGGSDDTQTSGAPESGTSTGVPPAADSTAALPPGRGDGGDAGCACTSDGDDARGGAWWLVGGLWLARGRRRRAWWFRGALAAGSAAGSASACGGPVVEFAEGSTSSTSVEATSTVDPSSPTNPSDPSDPSTSTTTPTSTTPTTSDPSDPDTGVATDDASETSASSADSSETSTGATETTAEDGSSTSTTGVSTRGQDCIIDDDCEPDAPNCVFSICYDGSEDDPCVVGGDCAPANACVFGACSEGSEGDPCIFDSDCGDAPFCVNSSCWDGSNGDECLDNGDCDDAPFCAQTLCNDGTLGAPCDNDADCDDAPFCVFAVCYDGIEGDPCVTGSDCAPSAPNCVASVCYDGTDGDPCVLPADCENDCVDSVCA